MDKGYEIVELIERINFDNIRELNQIIEILESNIQIINNLLDPSITPQDINRRKLIYQQLSLLSLKLILQRATV